MLEKLGPAERLGWSPRRRLRFGYFLPAEFYEAIVSKLVTPGCRWLDVGGGHDVFPENPRLAEALVRRAGTLVAVDPSPNVRRHPLAAARVESSIEEYRADAPFDLATMRMVVEHVRDPRAFVDALARLVAPGGLAVVFTVNARSPISLVSRWMPFALHHPIKTLFWGGDKDDTFPVCYRMNTRAVLRRWFGAAGFEERAFVRPDDLSALSTFKRLNLLELYAWRVCRRIGLRYPEYCLIGVYVRVPDRQPRPAGG